MHAPARNGLPPVEANLPLHTRENFSLMRQVDSHRSDGTAYVFLMFPELVPASSNSLDKCLEKWVGPNMSSIFEYRRLAAASLDLAQRTAVLADKTRFLLIAEAWLKLADRVARKSADGKRRAAGRIERAAEHPSVTSILSNDVRSEARGDSTCHTQHVQRADDPPPACN
jgi:hypothetical protein